MPTISFQGFGASNLVSVLPAKRNEGSPTNSTAIKIGRIQTALIPQNDSVQFLGNTSKAQEVKEVAKIEAKAKKKGLVEWGKVAVKYTFKTAFQIVKNCFSLDDLKNGASHVKQAILNVSTNMDHIWQNIPGYLANGWEFAKEHLMPYMQDIFMFVGKVIHKVIEHAVSFSGSSPKKGQAHPLLFQGNTQSSPGSHAASNTPAREPVELTATQETVLERRLMSAKDKFARAANKRFDTTSQRETNSVRYGTDVFNALYESLAQSQPGLNDTVLKDVHGIVNELNTLTSEVSQKENFSDLREETQNRMIDLITLTLKHPEPLISNFGRDMAAALGISPKTTDALRTA
jgi:hypothetical protein